ncbi:MAG: DUF2442 domain-containing protein [Planctomycetes bacterium]|nr:DUF2442 domain-containing protein [Planctomycetota bacterium]
MKVCGSHEMVLTFNDGVRKRVNLKPLLKGLIFKPLLSPSFFARATLDAESGTVVWPNGADFAPEALYEIKARPTAHLAVGALRRKAGA